MSKPSLPADLSSADNFDLTLNGSYGGRTRGSRAWFVWLFVMLAGLWPAAQPEAFSHGDTPASLPLMPGLLVLRDSTGSLDFDAVTSPASLDQWQAAKSMPNFGITDDVMWLALALTWSEQAESRWLLHIQAPLTDRIDIFRFTVAANNERATHRRAPRLIADPSVFSSAVDSMAENRAAISVVHDTVGAEFPFYERLVNDRDFSFWLEPDAGVQWTVLRISSSLSLRAPLTLMSEQAFFARSTLEHFLQGGFFGLMAIMAMLSIGVYAVTRDPAYASYAGFVLGVSAFLLVYNGYAFQFLWPDSPEWNLRSLPVFLTFATVMSVLFAVVFLQLKQTLPIMYRVAQLMGLLWATLFLYAAFGSSYEALAFIGGLMPIGAVVLVVVAGLCLHRKVPGAGYYSLGWLGIIIGAVVMILIERGLIPASRATLSVFQVTCVLESIVLAFALGMRLNRQLHERITAERAALADLNEAQLAKIEAQAQTRMQLEHHVRERTHALEQTMSRLADANMELKLLSTTDELTQLSNRRSINVTLNREWSRSARNGGSLSVILLDLDHFKLVNDQHGHPCGDEVLRSTATLLSDVVQRPADLVGRYGGEEFIIVLADTPLDTATALAERIRRSIEDNIVRHEAISLRVTASIGLASCDPALEGSLQNGVQKSEPLFSSSEALVHAADQALYLAKRRGRNQVVAMNQELHG